MNSRKYKQRFSRNFLLLDRCHLLAALNSTLLTQHIILREASRITGQPDRRNDSITNYPIKVNLESSF